MALHRLTSMWFLFFYAKVKWHYTCVMYESDPPCKDARFTHVPSSHPPLPASHKRRVSRVYARPRPLRPAGGNTLDDITATRTHWPRDVPHLSNRLPVKWRQRRSVPFTFSGVGGAERLSTSVPAGCYAVIGWKSGESERLLLRENGRGRERHRCVGCATEVILLWWKLLKHELMVIFSCVNAFALLTWVITHNKYTL